MSPVRPKRAVPNGRPKPRTHLRVDMPTDLHRALKAEAALLGISTAAFINALVRDALGRAQEAVS